MGLCCFSVALARLGAIWWAELTTRPPKRAAFWTTWPELKVTR